MMKELFIGYLKFRFKLILIGNLYLIVLLLNKLSYMDWLPNCIIKSNTGYSCFACGTNRSLLYLLEGDVLSSVEQNPMGVLIIFIALLIIRFDFRAYKSNIRQ